MCFWKSKLKVAFYHFAWGREYFAFWTWKQFYSDNRNIFSVLSTMCESKTLLKLFILINQMLVHFVVFPYKSFQAVIFDSICFSDISYFSSCTHEISIICLINFISQRVPREIKAGGKFRSKSFLPSSILPNSVRSGKERCYNCSRWRCMLVPITVLSTRWQGPLLLSADLIDKINSLSVISHNNRGEDNSLFKTCKFITLVSYYIFTQSIFNDMNLLLFCI